MEEIWKDVLNFEGIYQVSNLGRVKRIKTNRILKLSKSGFNYVGTCLSKNGQIKSKYVHQLVAESFLGHIPCGHKYVIDHINDDTKDNRLENLRVVTQRENTYKTRGKYTSKYKGVSFVKHLNKWRSSIYFNKKRKVLGYFIDEYEAHLAYQNALKNLEL